MRRRAVSIIISALLLLSLSATAFAAGLDEIVDAAPEAAREAAAEIAEGGETDVALFLRRLIENVLFGGDDPIKGALKNAAAVFAAVLISALASAFLGDKSGLSAARLAAVLAICAVSIGGVRSLIGSCEKAMDELSAFSAVLLPALASASAVTGKAMTASASLYAATLFIAILSSLTKKALIPLIYAFVAASAASHSFGGAISAAAKLIKWAINTILIAIASAFTLFLTLSGAIASKADAVAVKAARTAIGNFVPVVGRLITDASETVAAGLDAVKAASGAIGIIAVVTLAAAPAVRAAANHLMFRAASVLSEPIAGKEISGFIGDVGTAMGFSVGAVGLQSVMLIISISAAVKAVSS